MDDLREIFQEVIRRMELLWSIDYGDVLFLPRGKGPSILILGGLTMLAVSLYLSLRAPDGRPASASPAGSGPPRASAAAGPRADPGSAPPGRPSPSRPPAVQAALETAREANLGSPRLVSAEPGRHAIAFETCPSHRRPDRPGPGCSTAREVLERGLRVRGATGRVVRTSCRVGDGGSCVFEIRPGEPSS